MPNKKPPNLAVFDVMTPVETSQKNTHWFNLGRAWESVHNGKRRILVKLNAHPLGNTLYLYERTGEDSERLPSGNEPNNDGMLDDIPH